MRSVRWGIGVRQRFVNRGVWTNGVAKTKTKRPIKWKIIEQSRNVHTVRMVAENSKWDQYFLLSSDRHHDNAHADHALERKHLDLAVERGAGIVDVGDMHCAMQGKFDKRSDLTACRPEQQEGRYIDSLVECAADFYAPYAENFVVIGTGNHETSILKRHETDLTERTCERMSAISGHKVHSGGYGGWVRFVVKINNTNRQCNMKYFHGSGGGGPVTRGVIQTNRMAVIFPQANIIVSGHTHDQWIVPIAREKLYKSGKVGMDEALHVRCGTYKDEYLDGFGGWHIERGGPPKSLGAMWLRFYVTSSKNNEVGWEVIRAT